MAESVLIVEGWDDRAFFESLIQKTFEKKPEELGLDIRVGRDKTQAKDVLRTYVRQGFIKIGIARDINDSSPQEEEGHIRANLASEVKSRVKIERGFLLAGESRVMVIPTGLYNDEELKGLGITRYEMEDYLVKLVLRESPQQLEELLPVLKRYGLKRSKELLQPLKAPFRFSDDDRAFTRFLIEKTDKAIVADIMGNVLSKIEALLQGIEEVER